MTVRAGNLNDQSHFKATYSQVRHLLKDESLVIFDRGASSQENKKLVVYGNMRCLSSKKRNFSNFDRMNDAILRKCGAIS